VTCSAADGSGNTAQVQFDVVVEDTTPPTLSLPADITEEATSASGARVVFSASANDLVDGEVMVACTPASGTIFPLDATPVSCSATDAAGNTAHGGFTITVEDTTAPVIAPHPDVGPVEATGPGGAQVFYTAPATTDAVDGPGVALCLPESGTIFAIGATSVTCTAVDAAGNAALPTGFTVRVHDSTPPEVTPPADVQAEATGPLTAVAFGSATATDAVGVVSLTHDAPASFPLGATAITWTARDAAGNIGTATSTVTVLDTTAPAFDAYADVTATATGSSQAVVHFPLPTASDLVDGPVAVTCSHASGASFPAGSTTVTCSAQDGRTPANVATLGFRVHVTYAWTGFFKPIDNLPVWNAVKAGSAVPVKFSLGGNQGLDILAAGSPSSGMVACDASAPADEVSETVTAGQSSLTYDAAANQYVYVWKTEKGWANSCRALQVKLRDGRSYWAVFQFRK
jgi:hypothetical protein